MKLIFTSLLGTKVYDINGKYKGNLNHTAGFFSTCSYWLTDIIEITNHLSNSNFYLDTTNSFNIYKNSNKQGNIALEYFKYDDKNKEMPRKKYFNGGQIQHLPYKNIDFKNITPYINKYFSPTDTINKIITEMEKKYSIDYDNTCCVFYRGLDKCKETISPQYDIFCNKVLELMKTKNNIKYLLQTDETEFFNYSKKYFKNNIIFEDEIRHINHNPGSQTDYCLNKEENFKYSLNFLAIVIIMSRCKYVVCTSSNVSFWIALFRGNTNNFHQYLKQKPFINNALNPLYDPTVNKLWYSNNDKSYCSDIMWIRAISSTKAYQNGILKSWLQKNKNGYISDDITI